MSGDFDWIRRLGGGQFGEVWLATDRGLKAERAVKRIPPHKVLDPNNFFQEAQALKAAQHSNIVRVEDTGILSDGRIYVAMEYLPKGSLEGETAGSYIPLTRAKRVMIDVLRGLQHAHTKGILHRDIKPANILVGEVLEGKLSDFGLAIPAGTSPSTAGLNDYNYALHLAPEVLLGSDFLASSDIYACGVTLYRLINGDAYLPELTLDEVCEKAIEGKFPDRTKYREFVPRSLRVLLNKAMNVDPAQRFSSAEEMRHALEKVEIHMNWDERHFGERTFWTCSWNGKCYEVVRAADTKDGWHVEILKGKSKTTQRRMNSICRYHLSYGEAQQHSRRVLQDFVTGKLS